MMFGGLQTQMPVGGASLLGLASFRGVGLTFSGHPHPLSRRCPTSTGENDRIAVTADRMNSGF
jgi:hypothetical protein